MKKLLTRGPVVAVLSIATPTANAASTVRCGKIWRVDAGVWVTVTDVGHRHNCRLSRKVARNVYSDMGGPGFRMSGYLWLEANWPGSDRVMYENRKGHAFRIKYGRYRG